MLTGLHNVRIFRDAEELARAAAEQVLRIARHSIEAGGSFHIALAGGRTPQRLYQLLADPALREHTDWSRWQVYFGDERCVPPDHPDSNYRMAREALLDHVPLPPGRVHPMVADPGDPQAAARAYEELLRRELPEEGAGPVLDLALLGLGQDGHTASLFPGTPVLEERDRLVAAVHLPKLDAWRVSMTFPLLERARQILFVVSGGAKARVVGDIARGTAAPVYPVQRLAPQGTVLWYLDQPAAGALR